MPKVGLIVRCYHATQYLEKVLKQYAWVDKVVVLNYRFNTVDETFDNTKEIFDKFEHPDKQLFSGVCDKQVDILNMGLVLLKEMDVVFTPDADEFIHIDEQKKIFNRLRNSEFNCAAVNIMDYNGDLFHASPQRDYLTIVAVDPKNFKFHHIRSADARDKKLCLPEIVMQHLGLVFTPEVIEWKSNWEYLEEKHSRDKLLKDWAVKREVTPPQWLLEILKNE